MTVAWQQLLQRATRDYLLKDTSAQQACVVQRPKWWEEAEMRSELFTQSTTGQVTFDVAAICNEFREFLLDPPPQEVRAPPRWISVVISGFRNCLVTTNHLTLSVDWVPLFERFLHEEGYTVWLVLPQAGDRTSLFFRCQGLYSWDDTLCSVWIRWLHQVPPLSRMDEAMFRIPFGAMDAWRDGLARFCAPPSCFACISFKVTKTFDLWVYFREDDTVAPTCVLLDYEDMFMDLASRAPVLTTERWIQTLQWHSPCLHTIPFAITHHQEVDQWFLPHHLFHEYNHCLKRRMPRSDLECAATCLVGWLTQLAGMWGVAGISLNQEDPQLTETINCSDDFSMTRAAIIYATRCRMLEGCKLASSLKYFFNVAIALRRIARRYLQGEQRQQGAAAADDIPKEWFKCIQTSTRDADASWFQMPSCIATHLLHQEHSLPSDLMMASSFPLECSFANNLLFREKSLRWLQEMIHLTLYAAEWQQLLDMFWGTWWPKILEQLVSCKLKDIRVSASVPLESAARHARVCAQVLPFDVSCFRCLRDDSVSIEVSVPANRLWRSPVGVVATHQYHLKRWCHKVTNLMQNTALDAFAEEILQQLQAGVNEGFVDVSLPVHVPVRDLLTKLGITYPNYQHLHSDDVNTRCIRVFL